MSAPAQENHVTSWPHRLGKWTSNHIGTLGAIIAFFVGTFFNAISAHDSKESSLAAERSAAASEQSALASQRANAIAQASVLITSCSETSASIPNTPDRVLVPISEALTYLPPQTSTSRSSEQRVPIRRPPHTFEYCRLYNYGTLPILNAYLVYAMHFYDVGHEPIGSFEPYDVPSRNDFPIYFSAVPANSSAEYELYNVGTKVVYAVREPYIVFEAPPDYSRSTYNFHTDNFSFLKLGPVSSKEAAAESCADGTALCLNANQVR